MSFCFCVLECVFDCYLCVWICLGVVCDMFYGFLCCVAIFIVFFLICVFNVLMSLIWFVLGFSGVCSAMCLRFPVVFFGCSGMCLGFVWISFWDLVLGLSGACSLILCGAQVFVVGICFWEVS